jgi:hypothetical protein
MPQFDSKTTLNQFYIISEKSSLFPRQRIHATPGLKDPDVFKPSHGPKRFICAREIQRFVEIFASSRFDIFGDDSQKVAN